MGVELNPNYFIRQSGLVDPLVLDKRILIVGAGGIGSWSTLALMKMGCQNVHVIDFDTVEEHNVGSQVYSPFDIGLSKLEALEKRLKGLVEHTATYESLTLDPGNVGLLTQHDIVVSAVDNISVRKMMFDSMKGMPILYIDGRMAGNAIEIYTLEMNDPVAVQNYEATLFDPEEAIPIPCSERAIIYNCFVMAGLIADIVGQRSKNEPTPFEMSVDLLNFTLFNE